MPLQLRSTVNSGGQLELSLVEVPMPEPQADEIVVRIEASPINPSDLGLLLSFADHQSEQGPGLVAAVALRSNAP